MNTQTRSSNLHRAHRGLTIMEMMVSLAITGMLLTGLASAFVSSADSIAANEQFFRATQAARVTLNQVLVECRRADALQCSNTGTYDYFDVIRPEEVLLTDEVSRRYAFDKVNKQLTLTINYVDGTSSPPYIMVRNVEAAEFGPPQTGVDANNATVVQRLPVVLTVRFGKNAVTLHGAAGPRRAMKF